MILTVFESCEVGRGQSSTDKPCIGKIKNLRVVRYNVKAKDLHEALEEYASSTTTSLCPLKTISRESVTTRA